MRKTILVVALLISAVTFAQKATITTFPTEPISKGAVVEVEGTYNAGENQTVGENGVAFVLRVFNTKTKKFVWKASNTDESTKGTKEGKASGKLKIRKNVPTSSELEENEEYRIFMTFKNSANRWISNWKAVTIVK
ncbi:hypothetical protein R3X25_01090 [Lutibacter sp. TH_r2]|uniref:hypothetical protein n=1 Tax=Lutibacter sp. TH_r2 TaxID=3082083 RepID=UPI00295590B7|nr:hypothetical protein [Lutibacter sp. TH_r2]MDV7185858.1 hypothetical protein [Lutibacter sp. TH_r2]